MAWCVKTMSLVLNEIIQQGLAEGPADKMLALQHEVLSSNLDPTQKKKVQGLERWFSS